MNTRRRLVTVVASLLLLSLAAVASADPGSDSDCRLPFCHVSEDGWFRFNTVGRLQIDMSGYRNDRNTNLETGTNVRRARITAVAELGSDWVLDFTYDFARQGFENIHSTDIDGIRDAIVQYNGLGILRIQAGHYKEPFGMERLTSVRDLPFMERSLSSELTPERNTGLELHAHTRHWTAAAGAFIPGTATTNTDMRYGLTGRTTFAPRSDNGDILHFGAAISYREMGNSKNVQFRQRPESRTTDQRLIDTGLIQAHDYMLYGVESAYSKGSWAIQGEYILAHLNRAGAGRDLLFDGWHVDATWLITGEHQPYNHEKGTFGRIRPNRNAGQDGPGAIKLGLRVSGLNLNSADVVGGRQHNLTAGVTWFLNPQVTIIGEYIQVLDVKGGPFDGARPSVVQSRIQFIF